MVVSTQQITAYSTSLFNDSPTLLPENIAAFITAIALAARLSLRCSALLIEALLESAKHSTSFSFGLSRQALINALSTAKKLHQMTAPSSSAVVTSDHQSSSTIEYERYKKKSIHHNKKTNKTKILFVTCFFSLFFFLNKICRSGFLQVLDKYTNLGIYVVHHSFTLVELFALSGIQFTSQTIKSGLMVCLFLIYIFVLFIS